MAVIENAMICAHCGLPAPGETTTPAFCCAGCRTAWRIIHDVGLAAYYALPERRAAPVTASPRGFEELDHPSFHERYVKRRADGLAETELYLEGVHCASCVWLVEHVPIALPGLRAAALDVRRAVVRLEWNPDSVRLSAIAHALDRLGYRAVPFRGRNAEEARRREDRAALGAIGIAAALAMNVMALALALYSGMFGGMEHAYERYFRWLSLALTAPALFGPGRVFFRSAWGALRARALHMDVPIALALAAGFLRGAWNTVTDSGPIYFDGVATLVFLLLVGRFLERRAQRAAADSAELLHALSPAIAHRVEDGEVRDVPVEALLPGNVLEVRAWDTVPADGRVIAGGSTLDLSLLTGESRPVAIGVGDRVHAGTVNQGAPLTIEVERAGAETRLGAILASVADGARRRAPVVRLADRFAAGFIGLVLVLAALTWMITARHDPAGALDRAIALLIVTCPCALALATPLTVSAAIGRAARRGILIKGGDALEKLARPGRIVLDKTGTLTLGLTALETWEGPDSLRGAVLALERHSHHPLAEGFRAAWPEVPADTARDVRVTLGAGVEGVVAGREIVVGATSFVRRRAREAGALTDLAESSRLTPVLVAVEGRIVGRAGFADPIREEAPEVLRRLRSRGWELALLSGDDPRVAAEVGRRLEIPDCRGGATPEEKLAVIAESARRGPVVMVGDGVNDAAAMARATVGVGVRGGAEACLAAADVALVAPGLEPLVELVDGARRTLAVIRRGIAFSLVYNVAGVALAMTGVINPLIAAVLMPVSSITVVVAAYSSRTFRRLRSPADRPQVASPPSAVPRERNWPLPAVPESPGPGS